VRVREISWWKTLTRWARERIPPWPTNQQQPHQSKTGTVSWCVPLVPECLTLYTVHFLGNDLRYTDFERENFRSLSTMQPPSASGFLGLKLVSVIRLVCFDFVHEAIYPYSIEGLRYIEEHCAAVFPMLKCCAYFWFYSVYLFDCSMVLTKAKLMSTDNIVCS